MIVCTVKEKLEELGLQSLLINNPSFADDYIDATVALKAKIDEKGVSHIIADGQVLYSWNRVAFCSSDKYPYKTRLSIAVVMKIVDNDVVLRLSLIG